MMRVQWVFLKKYFAGHGALIALVIMLLTASLVYEEFFTYNYISNVLRQTSMVGLISLNWRN